MALTGTIWAQFSNGFFCRAQVTCGSLFLAAIYERLYPGTAPGQFSHRHDTRLSDLSLLACRWHDHTNMKKYLQLIIIIECTLCYLPTLAEQAQQLTWEDLVPSGQQSEDPFANMTQEQKDLAFWVIYIRESLLDRMQEDRDGLMDELKKATRELEDAGIDIDKVIAERQKIRRSIVSELNGKRIRMAGHLLPLEFSGTKTTEFLLVPYVGACIHALPPPPNQIVHVKTAPMNGYMIKKLYEIVWVTGIIMAKSMVKELYYVDGSDNINIGYAMQATQIEPYKK